MIRQRLKAVVGCFHVRFCVLAWRIKPERSHRVKGTAKLFKSGEQLPDGTAKVYSRLNLQLLEEHFGMVDPGAC